MIIPARDEEENINRLLPSLQGEDFAPHEIIVVDDGSADGTAAKARESGATVIAGKSLPDGWLGKPWACRQGVDASTGEWLLFLDADTEFQPGGLRKLAALAGSDDEAHSVAPYHRVIAPYEQLSAFFNVIMLLGMNAFTLKGPRARDIGLFGQVLLVARRSYEAAGGHNAVKREVLENFHLSRHLAKAGVSCRCWLGRGTVGMRMFPGGLRELIAGWGKGVISGAGNTPRRTMAGIAIWISGLFMGATALVISLLAGAPLTPAIAGAYLLHVAQVYFLFRQAGTFGLLSALLFPLGLVFYQFVFAQAHRRKSRGEAVQWKGRNVD